MRAGIEGSGQTGVATTATSPRVRAVVADASLDFMAVVLGLLEFHEVVDVIGRASSFEETLQLVVNHEPDLVLLDLDMPLASLAIPAIVLAAPRPVKIIAMYSAETIFMASTETLATVDALIDREHLTDEFLAAMQSGFRGAASGSSISSSPKQTNHPWRAGLNRWTLH